MNAFPHIEQQKNVPGYDTFYFANAETITAPSPIANVLATAPSMGGAVFYEGYSTLGKLQYECQPQNTPDGVHYQVAVKGFIPKHKSTILVLFEEMIDKYFNIIIRDKNGKYIWIGSSATLGLNFTYAQTDGGYTFEFSGAQIFAPPFFTGTIPV